MDCFPEKEEIAKQLGANCFCLTKDLCEKSEKWFHSTLEFQKREEIREGELECQQVNVSV